MITNTLTPKLLHLKDVAISRMCELLPDLKTRLVIVVNTLHFLSVDAVSPAQSDQSGLDQSRPVCPVGRAWRRRQVQSAKGSTMLMRRQDDRDTWH